MSFTTWQFALFATLIFGLYYVPAARPFQVQILLLASLIFYGYGQPELLVLLAAAVFGTYLFLTLSMTDRRWLAAGITYNLGLLAFFKYKFLFIELSNAPLSSNAAVDFLLKLPLPIGISFFVFHNISLLVDIVKRKELPPSISNVLLYIIFFPQLVAGPITRAENFLPQIQPKFAKDVPFVEATKWIIVGYFFKLYVANNLNQFTLHMDYPFYEAVRTLDKWMLVLLYSYQIYADFFGYSSIAIGLGLLFGYKLPINFNLPYIAKSFSEFWTRWHISLSTWLRIYLYIPLGGSRQGAARTYLNLMIVMALGGLWHGAGISYLIWGVLHGLFLIVERPFLRLQDSQPADSRFRTMTTFTHVAIVFFCVTMAWIFFKLPNYHHAMTYIAGMFSINEIPRPTKFLPILAALYSLPVIAQHIAGAWLGFRKAIEPYAYGGMAALAIIEAGPDTSFIYFQF